VTCLGVTFARQVALVDRGADYRTPTQARSVQAVVGLSTGVPITARGSILDRRIATNAGGWIAGSSDVTLIGGRADNGVGPQACSLDASVGLRAGIRISASGSVRCEGIGADTRARIARPSDVALVGGRADNGVGAQARSFDASVGLCAGVRISASGSVRRRGIGADTSSRIARPRDVTLIGRRAND
jgi:hypothetical protein